MTPKVIIQPSAELLTIEDCRAHLNLDAIDDIDSDGIGTTHPDDALIMALQGAAREHCENFLGMSIARRTYEIALDTFPHSSNRFHGQARTGNASSAHDAIELPIAPLIGIDSISVGDDSDGLVDSATYVVDDFSVPARVVPVTTWPTLVAATNQVRIRFEAGFGDDSDGAQPLPFAIRAAMLLILGHLYKNREDSVDKAMQSLPGGAEALLRPLRVRKGLA